LNRRISLAGKSKGRGFCLFAGRGRRLKEWAWPGSVENYNHRHVSHHYSAWPGIALRGRIRRAAQAILISIKKRGQQNDSAHGIIHRLFTAIRLKHLADTINNLQHSWSMVFSPER
jgi:hypothetical protein